MDDASFNSNQPGGDPGMMGDPNDMGGGIDMPEEPGIGSDPNMGGNIGAGEGLGMDGGQGMMDSPEGMGAGQNGGLGDDTMSIISQLSDEDKDAVRAYAESMLSRDETQNQNEIGEQPMMEQVIFTKRQLNKIQENFGPTQDELNTNKERAKTLSKKNEKTTSGKSPFNPPSFS